MKTNFLKRSLSCICAAALVCCMIPGVSAGNTGAIGMALTTACGENYSAAIDDNGELYMWGYNYQNYLGVDTGGADVVTPTKVMDNVASVYVPSEMSSLICVAVIKTDGTLWTWGDNTFGRLGNGNEISTGEPQKIMENVAAAAVGFKHAAAIKKDGTLWTWGLNNYGQLGDGTKDNHSTPIKIMDNVVSVSAGFWHTAAVTSDGQLWTWGCNRYNELGDNTNETRLEPVKVMDDVVWAQACGEMTAAVKKDGTVWTCGTNNNHELGHSTDKRNADFNQVQGLKNVKLMSLGYRFCLAVTESGEMYGWGCGGALGDGQILSQTPLTKITENVNSAAAGYNHSLILKDDGTLLSCGRNYNGQLGDGNHETNTWTLIPTGVQGIGKVKLVKKEQAVLPTATPTPTAAPTATPTAEPTATPTAEPTATPTAAPTATPTAEPTATPTVEPTATPTAAPTATPTTAPTATPTVEPTATPTVEPTAEPTSTPTVEPTSTPTDAPQKITPIGKYENTVEIEKVISSGKVIFTVTPAEDTRLPKMGLVTAEYDDAGRLIKAAFAEGDISDERAVFTALLPETKKYKYMMWDASQIPVIEAITNIN